MMFPELLDMNTPNKNYRHLYVVIRVDLPFDKQSFEDCFTLTKCFESEKKASEEVQRMNELNSKKNCKYFSRVVRFVPNNYKLKRAIEK